MTDQRETPQCCPDCGSDKKEVYLTVQFKRGKIECHHPWHNTAPAPAPAKPYDKRKKIKYKSEAEAPAPVPSFPTDRTDDWEARQDAKRQAASPSRYCPNPDVCPCG